MADSGTAGGLAAVPRQPMDTAAYEKRSREGPCFVCETLAQWGAAPPQEDPSLGSAPESSHSHPRGAYR